MNPVVLVNDVALILEMAERAPRFAERTIEEAIAYADGFDVFFCVWLDPPRKHGWGMEVVKAKGQRLVGDKVIKCNSREQRFGAASVRNRAFACEMAQRLG